MYFTHNKIPHTLDEFIQVCKDNELNQDGKSWETCYNRVKHIQCTYYTRQQGIS